VGRRRNRYHLKNRLLKEGLKNARCERCGLTEWKGGPISLELHHVNGDPRDNRLEVLELLCPNCHAQTENFGIRNAAKRNGFATDEEVCD
jgi:ribosomal protein S27AE